MEKFAFLRLIQISKKYAGISENEPTLWVFPQFFLLFLQKGADIAEVNWHQMERKTDCLQQTQAKILIILIFNLI